MRSPLRFRGIVTCGSVGGFASPYSAAAVRCEATVPGGPARQATIARCCQVSRVPARTYTSRAARRQRFARTR